VQLYKVVTPLVTVLGLEKQDVAAPLTFHVTEPVTGIEFDPVRSAVTVTRVPTVGLAGVALTKIVGVATARLTDNIDVVAAL
jgi:hypothetical protein